MNAEAQKLIRLLEQECKRLRRLIVEDLREEDYKIADAHDKALQRALQKLRLVQNLEDKNTDRREFLKMLVDRSQGRASKRGYENPLLRRYESELANLEQLVPVTESNLLATQLRLVIAGAVRGINIVLSGSKHLSIQVRHQRECIKLAIPNLVELHYEGMIWEDQRKQLGTMGFASVSEQRLEMKFVKNDETHPRIMVMLSRIVFDVFHYNEFAGQSYIEVIKE
jgi:hypothetical protein